MHSIMLTLKIYVYFTNSLNVQVLKIKTVFKKVKDELVR